MYFARDAAYTDTLIDNSGSPVCRGPDGTRRVLLCLVTTGMSCLGAKDLPIHAVYRKTDESVSYDSAVDSLANPEIFVVSNGVQAYPAYLITYS